MHLHLKIIKCAKLDVDHFDIVDASVFFRESGETLLKLVISDIEVPVFKFPDEFIPHWLQ